MQDRDRQNQATARKRFVDAALEVPSPQGILSCLPVRTTVATRGEMRPISCMVALPLEPTCNAFCRRSSDCMPAQRLLNSHQLLFVWTYIERAEYVNVAARSRRSGKLGDRNVACEAGL